MPQIDQAVIHYLNSFAQKSWTFDSIVSFLTQNNLFKGGVVMTIFWWIWFTPGERQLNDRLTILKTFLGCCLAALLTMTLTCLMPFRERPFLNSEIGFIKPFGEFIFDLSKRSSFPSDHATVYFALSAGFWFISRKLGLMMTIYTLLFIAFPRVYCGLHYFTDILAGALVGTTVVLLTCLTKTGNSAGHQLMDVFKTRPGLAYALLFLFTFQAGTMFFDSRQFVRFDCHVISAWLGHWK